MNHGKLALKRIEELSERVYTGGSQSSAAVERRLSVRAERQSGVTCLSRQIRFRTTSSGAVTVTVAMAVSRSVTLEIFLDGQSVKRCSYANYTASSEVVCSGVQAGMHVAEVVVSGSSFTLNSFVMTVAGYILIGDDDVFVDVFPSDVGFIRLNLGRMDAYSLSGTVASPVATVVGVQSARCVGDAVALITDNQTACIMTGALTQSPSVTVLCGGADGVGGVPLDGGDMLVFVSKRGLIYFYCYILSEDKAVCIGTADGELDGAAAVLYGNRLYLAAQRQGNVELAESDLLSHYKPTDCFTVTAKKEVA